MTIAKPDDGIRLHHIIYYIIIMKATILGSLYHHVMSLKLFAFKEHALLDSYGQNYIVNIVHTESVQLINYWTIILYT